MSALQHYDKVSAAAALDVIIRERKNSSHSSLQLTRMFEMDGNKYRADRDGNIWRLVYNTPQPGGAIEEVVASVQGILCKKDLPPFLGLISENSNRAKYLRQSVRITGYGQSTFETVALDVARIQAIFKRAVGSQLKDDPNISEDDGFVAFDASNRYFSPRNGNNQADECLISSEVDPNGSLKKAAGSAYVHTEENRVYYFEKSDDIGGGASFKEAGPQIFQEGDIVELQVSFIVIPLREQKSRMSFVLRSISLLEGKFTQEAFIRAASFERTSKQVSRPTLKRKVGYLDEQVSTTRTRLALMNIEDGVYDEGAAQEAEGGQTC